MTKQIELNMELYSLLIILEQADGLKVPKEIRKKLNELYNQIDDLLFKPLKEAHKDWGKLKLYLECEFDDE